MVNWQVLATVAAPIVALLVGIWLNRRFESRPVLLYHWGHVSSFKHPGQDGANVTLNTHSVVIRNVGRRAATNVRLSHGQLPYFNIWPPVQHRLEEVPDSGRDIVIPIVVPNEHLTISYLYFPPITYAEVNHGIKFDEGLATPIPVLLQRQYPVLLYYTAGALMIMGMSTLAYGLVELGTLIVKATSN